MQGNSRRKANTQYLRLPSPSHPSLFIRAAQHHSLSCPCYQFPLRWCFHCTFPTLCTPTGTSVCSAVKPSTLPSSSVSPSLWWALSHTHRSNISTLDCFLMPEILRGLCSYCVLDLKGILGALYIRGNPNIYSLVPTKEFFKDENDCLGRRGDGSVRKSDCPSSMMTCVWISAPI